MPAFSYWSSRLARYGKDGEPVAVFGAIPVEPARITSLEVVAPRVADAGRFVMRDMAANGLPCFVFESLRSAARQSWLYGFGRSYDDGRGIITNAADVWKGWHPLGLALDFGNGDPHRADTPWIATSQFWQMLHATCEKYGLRAGIHVGSSIDNPHAQWAACAVSPTWRSKALYQLGGNARIWRAVGAA